MKIMDGKKVSKDVRKELKLKVDKLKTQGIKPHLCIIRVGENPNSITYMKYKKKAANMIGIEYSEKIFPENIDQETILSKINEVNNDKDITGLIVQLPLPKHISIEQVLEVISPKKDVDGLTEENMNSLIEDRKGIWPCTPLGIMRLIDEYEINLKGMKVVVLGRSRIVGNPMRIMLENKGANVSVCHSQTKDISVFTKKADLIVSATGVPHLIKEDIVKEGVIIFDVGIFKKDGVIYGDVDFEGVSKKSSLITPNPGGVGPMTISMLLKNIVELASN